MGLTYSEAGVDIEKGDRFASFIGNIKSKAVSNSIGGFAGGIELDVEKYKKPVLLSCTDGVGTKLMVAQQLQKFDTLGIDLVAMCVNDLIVCGASPLVFLDYIGCGKLNEDVLKEVIKGVVEGCEQAGCTLAGGETAEMPDMYSDNEFDLAGFSVGIVEKSQMLPQLDRVEKGDILFGMASVGVHSNGLSLARKTIDINDRENMEKLLTPTKIYVKELEELLKSEMIISAAHITGGGLEGNIVRALPKELKPELTWDWEVPEIFFTIQKNGNISEDEMRKVFNMGIGMVLVIKKENEKSFSNFAKKCNIDVFKAGIVG
ncbi:phosphoribosylformylglycinamidine cyclo-ligase [Thiospirochaeta perfilievii]|uniref:Phosphoribosylformylglycinamidine cyclo-ligase n=1 Tax=Thiospirochaeta perfilievii TaxID=252967 RepID=A0A5C1QAC0_9SPIO|nr:phosphoribosylformylglycinamidine cyclo-ligase [Thiospirochaeta perfilievii]QEN03604.1 phosphoribosylformylglycinamidine cyclo-ligase [Thiospirochaeta perfilievii]